MVTDEPIDVCSGNSCGSVANPEDPESGSFEYESGASVEGAWELQEGYELDLMEFMLELCGFGGLNVKADLGTCISMLLGFPSCLRLRALATTPKPVSTRA